MLRSALPQGLDSLGFLNLVQCCLLDGQEHSRSKESAAFPGRCCEAETDPETSVRRYLFKTITSRSVFNVAFSNLNLF